ncbi:MAG TPA: SigE family RNA polymerase sigma factor [Micromonosporaceae bacterium]|jgi:RNA polymerase sigma-70 factor (sigma-E family)|nr:SigE family RNA polymerase sigma factor [Micromonosporaceae bacterium]
MRCDAEGEYVEYVKARLPRLRQAAYLLCGDVHRADDIVSGTLLALYRHWSRAAASNNLNAYVHRMLVHRYLDEKRLRWSRVVLTAPDGVDRASPEFDIDDRTDIESALRSLPSGQRAVLVLRYLCDLSVEETAGALHCSTGNVKAQTSRGLAALRPLLARIG